MYTTVYTVYTSKLKSGKLFTVYLGGMWKEGGLRLGECMHETQGVKESEI